MRSGGKVHHNLNSLKRLQFLSSVVQSSAAMCYMLVSTLFYRANKNATDGKSQLSSHRALRALTTSAYRPPRRLPCSALHAPHRLRSRP